MLVTATGLDLERKPACAQCYHRGPALLRDAPGAGGDHTGGGTDERGATGGDRAAIRADKRRGRRRTARALRRNQGCGRVRGTGAPARGTGPRCVPAGDRAGTGRGGRVPGHLSRARAEGRLGAGRGAALELVVRDRVPSRVAHTPLGLPALRVGGDDATRSRPARTCALTHVPELAPILDEELAALPACYREAIVLCNLQGVSREDAAKVLGIPEGTLSSRLANGRKKLAARLTKRGVVLSATALPLAMSEAQAATNVPNELVTKTCGLVANWAAGGAVPAPLVRLATGGFAVRKMLVLGVVLVVGVTGAVFAARPRDDVPPVDPPKPPACRDESGAGAERRVEAKGEGREVHFRAAACGACGREDTRGNNAVERDRDAPRGCGTRGSRKGEGTTLRGTRPRQCGQGQAPRLDHIRTRGLARRGCSGRQGGGDRHPGVRPHQWSPPTEVLDRERRDIVTERFKNDHPRPA